MENSNMVLFDNIVEELNSIIENSDEETKIKLIEFRGKLNALNICSGSADLSKTVEYIKSDVVNVLNVQVGRVPKNLVDKIISDLKCEIAELLGDDKDKYKIIYLPIVNY